MKERNKTKKIVTLGMLCASSIVLMMTVRFPIFPSAAFLEYEPMDIPLLIAGFHFGPLAGFMTVVVSSLIQALTVSAGIGGWVGAIMHIISSGTLVVVSSLIYRKNKTISQAIIALMAGVLAMTMVMVPANLVMTTKFYGVPFETVSAMILPVIVPFNLIKAGVNSVLAFFVYKPVSNFIYKSDEAESNIVQNEKA